MLNPQTDSQLFWTRKLEASTSIFHTSSSRSSAHSFLSGIPRTWFGNCSLPTSPGYCQHTYLNGCKHKHTWRPTESLSVSLNYFVPPWILAQCALEVSVLTSNSVSPGFTYSSFITWGKVYLFPNLLHIHSLLIGNTWLTTTKATM